MNGLAIPIDEYRAMMRTDNTPLSKEELDAWDKRAGSIRFGMTFREMVAAAGTPERTGSIDDGYEKKIFDAVKYNYGSVWISFTNGVVTRITRD